MPDQTILCCDCKIAFTFSEREAIFFASKGFTTPKRCKSCREKKRQERERDER